MLSAQVQDVVETTRAALKRHAPNDVESVRAAPPLVAFSSAGRTEAIALKRVLFDSLYRHPKVERTTGRAGVVLRTLFEAYHAAPVELPEDHRTGLEQRGPRALADYIAGMTDRYAAREYRRLTGERAFDADY
jgi:dGTPase